MSNSGKLSDKEDSHRAKLQLDNNNPVLGYKSLRNLALFFSVSMFAGASLLYCLLEPKNSMSFYNRMIFFPIKVKEHDIAEIGNAPVKSISFRSADGSRLDGWYLEPEGKRSEKIIIYNHGNGGNISHRSSIYPVFLSAGISVLAYDYRGYGSSEGSPSIEGICQDGLAAFDFVVNQLNYSPENIILLGESLGGGVATHVAERHPVSAVILQSTFSSLAHVARERVGFLRIFPDSSFPANTLDNLSFVSGKHPPLLIMHGDDDYVVPYSECERLLEHASEPYEFVRFPQAGHNDLVGRFRSRYFDTIVEFLAKNELVSKS